MDISVFYKQYVNATPQELAPNGYVLQDLVHRYPWFSLGYLLLFKALCGMGGDASLSQSEKTAAYVYSRKKLYFILQQTRKDFETLAEEEFFTLDITEQEAIFVPGTATDKTPEAFVDKAFRASANKGHGNVPAAEASTNVAVEASTNVPVRASTNVPVGASANVPIGAHETAQTQVPERTHGRMQTQAQAQVQVQAHETAHSKVLETAHSKVLETAHSKVLETAHSKVLETAQPKVLETAHSKVLETAQPKVLETAHSKVHKNVPGRMQDRAEGKVQGRGTGTASLSDAGPLEFVLDIPKDRNFYPGADYFGKEQMASVSLDVTTPIDRFISENPRFTQALKRAGENLDTSEQDAPPALKDDEFVTETLAKIYAAQGYHKLAIDCYAKLILLYPEKSTYFASLVEEIKQKSDN